MSANSPIWKGLPPGALTETAESGRLRLAERITYAQQLAGRYADAFAFANSHPRGSIWTISVSGATGLFCVDDTSLDLQKGGKGVVTVNYLYLGVTPPDEFALTPFEINPPIEKNPCFASLTKDDLDKARTAFNAATAAGQTTLTNAITSTTNNALTTSLINKWLRGEETYYLAGFKFQHTLQSFSAPEGFEGGVIQEPFGAFAGYVSGAGLEWLRQADELVWSNGIWKLTRTWIGAPSGHWDSDLYPAG